MENTTTSKMNIHPAMEQAIQLGQTLRFKFADNERHAIPLVYGRLKNGKTALLCYKLDKLPNGEVIQSVRLYDAAKITDIQETGQHIPFSLRVEYLVNRHFKHKTCASSGINV